MNKIAKLGIIAAAVMAATIALTGCTNNQYQERIEQQESVTLTDSLGIQAQQERLNREEDTTAVRYVYVMPIGSLDAIGYYVIKGGVYDASTQLAPEQELIRRCDTCDSFVRDSARDNGTYGGDGGDGFFFFTSDGALVELAFLAYIQSDQPIPTYVDVPRLTGE